MENVQGLELVVERLHEWFGCLSRAEIESMLREETSRYQERLRRGDGSLLAEHAAFERLQVIADDRRARGFEQDLDGGLAATG